MVSIGLSTTGSPTPSIVVAVVGNGCRIFYTANMERVHTERKRRWADYPCKKREQIQTACGRGEEGENKAVARRLGIRESNRLKLERVIRGSK
jgi:hypothetical protein